MALGFDTPFFSLAAYELFAGFSLYFAFFCILGWLIEMAYLSTAGQGLINSGTLQGPFIPAFAFGACIIYPFTLLAATFPLWLQLVFYAALATVIEYYAHFILEVLLGIRIWDYSDEFLHFQGRICLKYTIFWLILVSFLVYFLQPAFVLLIESLGTTTRYILAGFFWIVIPIDYIYSLRLFHKLSRTIKRICDVMDISEDRLHDLQFNRPRIMNEKKRVKKLMLDENIRDYAQLVQHHLLIDKIFENDPAFFHAVKDILEHPKYIEWHGYKEKSKLIYLQHLRVAELSWRFAKALNLNAELAARGALLCVYKRARLSPKGHASSMLFPQTTVLQWVMRDFGKLSKIETDIILWYKWPLNFKVPSSLEGLLVSFASKIVRSLEFRDIFGKLYKEELKHVESA